MIPRRRGGIAVCLLLSIAAPLQEETEHRRALRNSTFVPTAEPAQRRRLEEGLALLRAGQAKPALERLLRALVPGAPAPQLPWGERETRNLFELLADHLAAAPAEVRRDFAAPLEADARAALARAGNELRWLASLQRAYPGTRAALAARRRLVDLALEAGDGLLAARHLARLPRDERERRRGVVDALLRAELRGSGWPTTRGGLDGSPPPDTAPAPPEGPPYAIARWPKKGSFFTRVAGGVVGRDGHGRPVAVFQDPVSLLVVVEHEGRIEVDRVDLGALTGRRPARTALRPIHPCMLGDLLYCVHGGAVPLGATAERPVGGGTELFCLRRTDESPGFALRWRWSPAAAKSDPRARELSSLATIHPFVLATGQRNWVLISQPEDRLNRRIYAACFDQAGVLQWLRFIAKGAVLTAGLLEHRQETVRQEELRPVPMILADGRLVIETGLGVVAALDPVAGEPLWTFRTARLKALKMLEKPWTQPGLAAAGGMIYLAPSDSPWFYRLRLRPGIHDLLAGIPERRRSRTRFLGVVPQWNATYWFRRGLREAGPLRTLLEPEPGKRPLRYDAPPLQPGEELAVGPLLTSGSLILATNQTLYWLDLAKDLFYERAFDLAKIGRAGWGPAVPFAGGILFAGDEAPLLWR